MKKTKIAIETQQVLWEISPMENLLMTIRSVSIVSNFRRDKNFENYDFYNFFLIFEIIKIMSSLVFIQLFTVTIL